MTQKYELNRRELMKAVAAASVATFGYALPTYADDADKPVRGGRLRLGLKGGSTGDSLDPVALSAAVQYFLGYQFGNCLVERGPDGKLRGELAESWEPQEGGKKWVFKLRSGIDREQMVRNILSGYGDIGNDSPLNEVFPLYSDDLPVHSYDIDKARDHYKKSGHSGPLQLQVSDAAFPGAVDAAALFQQSAARAGIEITIKREAADGYWDDVWLKSPFCVSYWGSNTTEDQALSIAYQTGAAWNDTYWSNAEFDKLLADARSELDDAKRKTIYRKATSIVQEDGGHIIFMFPQAIAGYSKKLVNFHLDHFGATGKVTERSWFRAS